MRSLPSSSFYQIQGIPFEKLYTDFQKLKKSSAHQTHFGFTKMGSKVRHFRTTFFKKNALYVKRREKKIIFLLLSFSKRKRNMIYWRKTFLIKRSYFSNDVSLQYLFADKPVKSHVDKLRLFLVSPRKTWFLTESVTQDT